MLQKGLVKLRGKSSWLQKDLKFPGPLRASSKEMDLALPDPEFVLYSVALKFNFFENFIIKYPYR